MIVIEALLAIVILGAIAFYVACAWFSYRFFAAKPNIDAAIAQPVSILVPICGLDEGAIKNWTSLCVQNYADYEVLFGVVDPSDPAVPTLNQLSQQYPNRVRVFTGLPPRGINHKDSTLSYLLEKVQHDILIFVDSDIRVEPDYIHQVVTPIAQDRADVITCAYVGHDPKFIGAALASLGRCCDFIPSALIARSLDQGLRFAIGVTIATRKTTLEKFGGLQLNRIGSDYNLGKRAAQAGFRVELSHLVLESDTGRETIAELFQRELRWARTIRFNRGAIYYTMIFCYGIVFCVPLLLISQFAVWTIVLSIVALIVRYAQAAIAAFSVGSPKLLRWFWLIPLRDALSLTVWMFGAFGREAFWRGRRLRIEGDGLIQQLE